MESKKIKHSVSRRTHFTAFFMSLIGFAFTMRSLRPFPLLPIAAAAGLPLIGGISAAKIKDFKEMGQVGLQTLLNVSQLVSIFIILLAFIIVVICTIWLYKELRRDTIKRIISHLSGLYTALAMLQEGALSGTKEKECVAVSDQLVDEVLLLLKRRFLRRWLGPKSHALVVHALVNTKERTKITPGQLAIVAQQLHVFETMSRW